VLPSLRCDLAIRHLVHGFNGKDVCFESFVLKTFFQLAFGLAGAKDLDRVLTAMPSMFCTKPFIATPPVDDFYIVVS